MIKTCADRTQDSSDSKRKNSQYFSFSKKINYSIHRFLKNVVCMRSFNVNYSNTQSCLSHCPVCFCKKALSE